MVEIPLVLFSAQGCGYLWLQEGLTYTGSIEDACVAQEYRVTDMVCAGCIGNTPEILEVSILILCSDVLLNAWSVVGLWQCCTSRPVTVAMISCSLMWLLFLAFFFFWWTVQYGSRSILWKGPIHPTDWSLTDLTIHLGAVHAQFPSRPIAQRSAAGRPIGIIINISCEMSLKWPLSIIPSVFNGCIFFLCKGSPVSLSQFVHTSSGSSGPSAPWGASVWSRRMGLLHMGHTLRISSHLSRHLTGQKKGT